MNILHRRNLGFIYDLTQIVMCKTARRESWIDVFVRPGCESTDLRELENALARFDEVDPSLLLLGYRDRKKGSLIGNIFGEFASEYLDKCEISAFAEYLSHVEKMKNFVSNYYLGCDFCDGTLHMVASKKDLEAEVKSLLYEFFLFSEHFMEVVINEINKIALILQRFYSEKLEKLLECQESFNYVSLEKENSPFAKSKKWEYKLKTCYVSFSLVGRYAGLRGRNEEYGWMILGCDIHKCFGETIEPDIDIAAFGNAFGDKLRVKIVEEIVKNGEMTLADLAKRLGVVNTIAIYHLDILKKENLTLHRYQGRKVLYCLNTSQIDKGLAAIKTLCGGEEQ